MCASMVCIAETGDLMPSGDALGQLQGCLVCLGPGINEVNRVQRCGKVFCQEGGKKDLRPLNKLTVYHQVEVVGSLVRYSLDDFSAGMAHIAYRHSGNEIQVAFTRS